MLNSLIPSTSSPQNSILIPFFSVIAISTIPPLILNWDFVRDILEHCDVSVDREWIRQFEVR